MSLGTSSGAADPEDEYLEAEIDDEGDGFDDYPELELDEDDYEAFLEREFDADGQLKGEPRVVLAIGLAVVLLLALLVFVSS